MNYELNNASYYETVLMRDKYLYIQTINIASADVYYVVMTGKVKVYTNKHNI